MKSITLTPDNHTVVEGGRFEIGSRDFSSRRGSYQTFEVRISAKAARLSHLEVGDTVQFWDSGASEGPYQGCEGHILKPDGTRYHLMGSKDNGIDTGHPPILGLKMVKVEKLIWDSWFNERNELPELGGRLIRYQETGECFRQPLMALGDVDRLGIDYAREKFKAFNLQSALGEFKIPNGIRINESWENNKYYPAWDSGYYQFQKRIIKLVDSDKPMVDKTRILSTNANKS